MANKKTCPACGAPVSPGDEFCGFCGALIPRNKAVGQTEQASAAAVQAAPAAEGVREKRRVQTPQTVEELLAFCERHELPLSKMRFFIGLDYPGAKAYGIFKDKNGDFVVYKNKADGSRAVRYRGPDEAYAVASARASPRPGRPAIPLPPRTRATPTTTPTRRGPPAAPASGRPTPCSSASSPPRPRSRSAGRPPPSTTTRSRSRTSRRATISTTTTITTTTTTTGISTTTTSGPGIRSTPSTTS